MRQLGKPCWEKENIAKAITRLAQLNQSQTHYFLSSHSPIEGILNESNGKALNEEGFYKELTDPSLGEVLALVHGDPGTGKSHLIHWLKLRFDYALAIEEIEDVQPVLIQRRTGTLKDALEQFILQLGEEFSHFLDPVRQALNRISEATARAKLADAILIELGPSRADHGMPELRGQIKKITSHSEGFHNWLCRDGGVIDQIVKRWTEARQDDGEIAVEFGPEEFLVREMKYKSRKNNTEQMFALLEEFDDDAKLRDEAAALFNSALKDAVREMTGLSGTALRNTFDQIRAELKRRGKSLALFIEDVSVMSSSLDTEVVNALEPQSQEELCRMIAVLGMTEPGLKRLPDNQKDRADFIISVGGAVEEWRKKPKEVARFTARYLNAVRLPESEVKKIEKARQLSGDVNISACTNCEVNTECHKLFGKVEIGDISIGMFPFTVTAPQKLLENLELGKEEMRRNQRGLLMQIIRPVLGDRASLETGDFPEARLKVRMPEHTFWSGFEQKFCGDWSPHNQRRLKQFAQGWVNAQTEASLASQLKPFLTPLGFPEFTSAAHPLPVPPPIDDVSPPPVEPPDSKARKALERILQNLTKWQAGESLASDVRSLLAEFLRRGIRWEDQRTIPPYVWKKLIGSGGEYQFIKVEGFEKRPITQHFIVTFDRSDETRDLIEALAQFEYEGRRSWNFEHGEHHKRVAYKWLRKHRNRIVESLQPQGGKLDPKKPLISAIKFLSVAAMVRKRTNLSTEASALLREILSDSAVEMPIALTSEWRTMLGEFRSAHQIMKDFLLNELDIPQGRTGDTVFIDSRLILDYAVTSADKVAFETLSTEFSNSYWQHRFTGVVGLNNYSNLETVLEREFDAIRDRVDSISSVLSQCKYEMTDPQEAFDTLYRDLVELKDSLKKAEFPYPHPKFDEIWTSRVIVEKRGSWAQVFKKAQVLLISDHVKEVLLFDPAALEQAKDIIEAIGSFLDNLEREVAMLLGAIDKGGDTDELAKKLFDNLERIETLDAKLHGK